MSRTKTEWIEKDQLAELLKTQSPRDIAKVYGVSHQKVRRDAKAMGIPMPNRSEAMKMACASGKVVSPTKGKPMSTEMKEKISDAIAQSWKDQDPKDRKARIDGAKERWAELTKEQKEEMSRKAAKAVRQTSQYGSSTEKFIKDALVKDGYVVIQHESHKIGNESLEIDLFIPSIKTAIEINGLSHYEPIHGEESLIRQQKADRTKIGLLLSGGFVAIIVKLDRKHVSPAYHRKLYKAIKAVITKIGYRFPQPGDRLIDVHVP